MKLKRSAYATDQLRLSIVDIIKLLLGVRLRKDALEVTFDLPLSRGPTEVKSWWYDEKQNRLAGAYYLTVERNS